MPAVTTSSVLRRPKRSASRPATGSSAAKNSTAINCHFKKDT